MKEEMIKSGSNYNTKDMIKSGNNLNNEDLTLLREKLITDYSNQKGWDSKSLTTEQLLEIIGTSEYKNPGLIKS